MLNIVWFIYCSNLLKLAYDIINYSVDRDPSCLQYLWLCFNWMKSEQPLTFDIKMRTD